MVYIIGALRPKERDELEKRGWEFETIDEMIGEIIRTDRTRLAEQHEEEILGVFVDSDMFQVMDGPDWEKGVPREPDPVRKEPTMAERLEKFRNNLRSGPVSIRLNMEKNADGVVGDDPEEDKEWSILGWEKDPEADYTFNRGADTLVEAEFMGKALLEQEGYACVGLVHNPTDQTWSVNDLASWEVTIRSVYRLVRKPPATAFWVLIHRHRHGTDLEILWGPAEPTKEECEAAFQDFESDREDEWVDRYGPFDVPQPPKALAKPPTPWEDNSKQFPRLLAELWAHMEISEDTETGGDIGYFSVKIEDLCSSMDLNFDLVRELFERAERAWEEIKHG